MDAIVLHQPYASLVAIGAKPWETRHWKPPTRLIGQRMAIHAAKRPIRSDDFGDDVARAITTVLGAGWRKGAPLGGIVCTATLAGAYQVFEHGDRVALLINAIARSRAKSRATIDPFGDYSIGRWLWLYEDVRAVDPIVRTIGRQSIWRLPADVVREIDSPADPVA